MDFDISERAKRLTSSAIREILKVTEDPSVISFAGGIPAPQTFPVTLMQEAAARILAEAPHAALQYAPTEGYRPLREWIAERHGVHPDCVLITTGSQQGLDLLAKVLIDPGKRVLVENPSYLGALQAFSLFEPEFVPVECDANGIVTDALQRSGIAGARFLYTMPNFQNPTGRRMPEARRRDLMRAMAAENVVVVEDDPYGELSYDGKRLPSLLSIAPEHVVHLGSFSKIVSPGLRVGYAIAPRPLMMKLVQAKQASDLHTSSFTQRIIHDVVQTGFLAAHVDRIRALYLTQRNVMLDALERHCRSDLDWNVPEGGMFFWARTRHGIDTTELLEAMLAPASGAKVAFVPGAPFFAGVPDVATLRLSFVTVPPARIEEGVAQLARALSRFA
ncbi:MULTISPECIES: PLP-dependent aminotransferase family protein [Burkholderia]|uniref:PLP-dependent aminotransferase family protein n=1 Tax=Burkholderia sola TaxID=2843302 RepID=A0ABV2C982_9BURK|nr:MULTISPECIES: PLP-dependent aminotransferase family protein [unclassified Burkholderia]MBP0607666.1 PLP-dependent aminotransferase family protein [Burkholderia sp. CpTa8-5]MBP0717637.1 PLP-dependent aminotransferase family protein [Burkholderia sp. AcTa6-5]